MDLAKWWNTKGQFGKMGALALRRGFPRRHRFAQARVEGTDGKWTARKTPTRTVDGLVKERTSFAVKAALKNLLEAPVASGPAAKTKTKKATRRGNLNA